MKVEWDKVKVVAMRPELKFRLWHPYYRKMLKVVTIEWDHGYVDGRVRTHSSRILVPLHKANLLMYTGMKDRRGKEIYEGDIIKFPLSRDSIDKQFWSESEHPPGIAVIEWSSGTGGGWHCRSMAFIKTGKIIGNIYENPDLLINKRR